MRTLRLISLASIFSLLSTAASPHQAPSTAQPPTTSDPQAVALIQRALAALTGGTALSNVTLTGTARRIAGSDDETGTATLTATSSGGSKLGLNFPSGPRTEVRNPAGTSAQASVPSGAWSGPDSTLHSMVNHNVMTDADWFFPAFTLGNLLAPQAFVLSYVGSETLNGQAVLHVSATQQFPALSNSAPEATSLLQHLSQMDIYFNPTTSLPVALAFNTHPDDNELVDISVRAEFSNYQATSGAQIPLHVQKFLNNGLVLDLQLTNATLNSGLSARLFHVQRGNRR